ncbi:hypothetical protein MASR2M16_10100 [Thauera terpenica]
MGEPSVNQRSRRRAEIFATLRRRAFPIKEDTMLHYAVIFFVIALIAAVFGFGGIAAGAAGIAKILFVVFLVMAVASFLINASRGR